MKFYHATDYSRLDSIMEKGLLNSNIEGIVYLTKDPKDAIKFPAVHLVTDILVVEVELDENDVQETFDHNERFFRCKAYGYPGNISTDDIVGYSRYQLNK